MEIRALKADQSLHRRSEGELDVLNEIGCAIWSEPGTTIFGPDGPVWQTDRRVRTLFVRDARLNLLEIHDSNSIPKSVYLNIIAPAELSTNEVVYVDHELDVLNLVDGSEGAEILDADEFEEAIARYQYDQKLVRACWAAAHLGRSIASTWEFGLSSEDALNAFSSLLENNILT